jgi:hypothetical protein
MRNKPIVAFLFILSFFLFACKSPRQNKPGSNSESQNLLADGEYEIPEFRKMVNPSAIAEFKEKTDNPLNNWYFSVRLFETPKTFEYVLKMQFEEIRGEDTIKLPDFGTEPRPAIRKGVDRYSCIVGFLDKNNEFREYKKVYVKNGLTLSVTTLYHYSVSSTPVQ